MKLGSPITLMVIGVIATLILTLAVAIVLLTTGGGQAVSDNAAILGALVALGGVFTTQMVSIALDNRRTQESRDLEAQRARETALQNYLEQVGRLLIEKPLHQEGHGHTLSTLVRAHTLAVLEGLDADRKRILLLFLYEFGLLRWETRIVSLEGANLRGANLRNANLSHAELSETDLIDADLSEAHMNQARVAVSNLRRANLSGAFLYNTDMTETNLSEANLSEASMVGADLSIADLSEADLSEADLGRAALRRANLSRADLSGAKTNRGQLERSRPQRG